MTYCQWRRHVLLGTSEPAGLWSPQSDPQQTATADMIVLAYKLWCDEDYSQSNSKQIN